jgi:hypothetical protein
VPHAIAVDIYRSTCYIRDVRWGLDPGRWLGKARLHTGAPQVGDTGSWGMIMQGGQLMVNFRNIAVFIAVAGMMCGLGSVANAAHTPSHKRSTSQSAEMTGRHGKPEMILTGPVLSVSPTTGFIVIRHGAGKTAEEIPVEIDNKTTLTRGGSRVGLDQLKEGDRVRISYSGSAGDVMKTVEVVGGPSMRSGRGAKRM